MHIATASIEELDDKCISPRLGRKFDILRQRSRNARRLAAMKTNSATLAPHTPAAQTPDPALLNAEEFAALLAIDGSLRASRPPAAIEIRLRRLGLIEPSPLSRLPVRTLKGEALIAAAGVMSEGPLRAQALDFSTVFDEAPINSVEHG
jgi:hypothetical protein